MATTITTLIENHPAAGDAPLAHEHGISFLIEHEDRQIIFDTGQSDRAAANASALGFDLGSVTDIVISHGHYDHANGLPAVATAIGDSCTLHVSERFFDEKFTTSRTGPDGGPAYIGAAGDREWCEGQRFDLATLRTGEDREIAPGVHIVGGFERTHPREVDNPRFVVRRPGTPGELEVDDFRDEVCVVIETKEGLVMVVGCSHPGIMNMVTTVQRRFGAPIHALLGGTHLVEAEGERLEEAFALLTDGDPIALLGLSHCTGESAMAELEQRSSRFQRVVTGSVVRFG